MGYKYIPDSYNNLSIQEKFNNNDSFVNAQVLYRKGLEKIIKQFVDFKKIDEYIIKSNLNIPQVEDKNYNFYHKYSTLESNYIFLRNNFHVENLSFSELEKLKEVEKLDINFYSQTLERVIYESGDECFFGIAVEENLAKSKSIVFEFAYNQKKCKDLEQLKKIDEIINYSFEYISSRMKNNMTIPTSFIRYNAITDLYYNEIDQSKLIK